MIYFFALLVMSFSLNSTNLIPNSRVIDGFTEKFANLGTNPSILDGASNTFVQERIGDLTYYKEYFNHSVTSSNKCFYIALLFTLPIVAKILKDSEETISKQIQNVQDQKEQIEKELGSFREERKEEAEKTKNNDAQKKELLDKLNKLPSHKKIIIKSIIKSMGNSAFELLTNEFTVNNSVKIIIVSMLTYYYYITCKNFADKKFRSIVSLLNLLLGMFNKKIDILNKPMDMSNNNLIIQQLDSVNLQTKQIIQNFELKSSVKKRFISLFEVILNFMKG